MSDSSSTIHTQVRRYVVEHFLGGDATAVLLPETPLVSGGILDSLGVLELVSFLERTFAIELEAHEVTRDRFDSLADIEALVLSKLPPPS